MRNIEFGDGKTEWERDGVRYNARLVVGHLEEEAVVVIGVETGLAEPALAFLPIAEAERFYVQLGHLIEQLRRKQ